MGTIKKITNCITFCLFALLLSLTTTNASAQENSFTTSNDRSLYDAQTRALRQKARTQLEKDTEKLKDLKEINEDLNTQTARIKECADLNKVYNGDPTGSNDPDTYCQAIVGALPSEINFKGLAAWYDASTADGYEIDVNGKVQTLVDKSGNLNNLVQENANKRPTLITYGTEFDSQATNLNGKTALRFDGVQSNSTGDYLSSISTDAVNALGFKGDADFSIYMVVRSDSSYSNLNNYTNYMPLMSLSHHYNENPLSFNRLTVSGNLTWGKPDYGFSFSYHSGGRSYGHTGARTPGYVNRPLSFSIRRSPGEDITSTVNNITFTDTVNNPNVDLAKGRLILGHHPSTTGGHYQGDIIEVIIYNRNLDSTSHASVQAYLQAKYGLVDFSACADETRNLTQCSASTGVKDHGQFSSVFCPGTFGNCRETLKCNDGNWEEYTAASCPAPANCTSTTRSLTECTATTGTGVHGTTANLSCAIAHGNCTGTSDCFNGAWSGSANISCPPPPAPCLAATSTLGSIFTCTVDTPYMESGTTLNRSCSYTFFGNTTTLNGEITCENGTLKVNDGICFDNAYPLTSNGSTCTAYVSVTEGQSSTYSCTDNNTDTVLTATLTCNDPDINITNMTEQAICRGTPFMISKNGKTCGKNITLREGQTSNLECSDPSDGTVLNATINCASDHNLYATNVTSRSPASCSARTVNISSSSPSASCTANVPSLAHGSSKAVHCFGSYTPTYPSGAPTAYPTLTKVATCNDGSWSFGTTQGYSCSPATTLISNKCAAAPTNAIFPPPEGGTGQYSCISGSTVYMQDFMCRQVNPSTMNYYYNATTSALISKSGVTTRAAKSCASVSGNLTIGFSNNYKNLNLSAVGHGGTRTDSSFNYTTLCGPVASQTYTCTYGRFKCWDGEWTVDTQTCTAGACQSY